MARPARTGGCALADARRTAGAPARAGTIGSVLGSALAATTTASTPGLRDVRGFVLFAARGGAHAFASAHALGGAATPAARSASFA
jgi:hypothetical protein